MYPEVDVIVIGHLSRNPFWEETKAVRPPLATTSLIRSGDKRILVDPSLPGEMLAGRLHERSGLTPDRIDLVFLTSFHPTHRRGLDLFDEATWLISEAERETVAAHLDDLLEGDEAAPTATIEAELALLGRTEVAEDLVAEGIHLFPSPGVTPGTCALLVAGLQTTVIAGDAVLTREHFQRNQPAEAAADRARAAESLAEIYDIADVVFPGHDNMFIVGGGV